MDKLDSFQIRTLSGRLAPRTPLGTLLSFCVILGAAAPLRAQSDYATPLTFTTLAGQVGVRGDLDGAGTNALISSVNSIAVDGAGNLYVADAGNQAIRKITPAGVVTTIATDVLAEGIAVDKAGVVYTCADFGIMKISTDGVVSVLAGAPGGLTFMDGPPNVATFYNPSGLAVDGNGNLYVADTNDYAIRVVSTSTGFVSTLAGDPPGQYGFSDGTGSAARFDLPTAVAVDGSGNVYVTDAGGYTIRKVTSAGVVTTIAGTHGVIGGADGTGSAAQFNVPNGIAADAAGNLYVTDAADTIRMITPAGVVTTLAGLYRVPGSSDGTGSAALFQDPTGIAVDSKGNLFVADSMNLTIRESYASAPAAPAISESPGPQTVVAGGTATFTVTATGVPAPTYQWLLNGSPITNARNASLTLSNVQPSEAGSYSVVVTNSQGSATSAAAELALTTAASPRLINISTRAYVGTGASIAIAGFVVTGPAGSTEQVLVRGVGPTLASYGITGYLAQPTLTLFNSAGVPIASNTGWGTGGNAAQIAAAATACGAFALPSGSADCALLATLPPGSYTAEVTGAAGTTGIALAEVYEYGAGSAQLVNISTRASVGTSADVEIAGFVISGTQPMEVLLRAIGPTLSEFSLSGTLAQPSLNLINAGSTTVATNTVWTSNPVPMNGGGWSSISTQANITSAAAEVGAFALSSSSADSSLLITLSPGAYTSVVSGVGGTSGIALAEVYEVP
jgi:sugar lactone lactonase YvrE